MGNGRRAAALAVLAVLAVLAACEAPTTRVRIVHASGTTTALDVSVGGALHTSGLAFGDATGWISARPGDVIDLRPAGTTTLAAATIPGPGDHVVVFTSSGLSTALLPPAQGRGLELVLVPASFGRGVRLGVPDRPGLVAEVTLGRAASLVLPADVGVVTLSDGAGGSAERLFGIDPAMRAARRVLLVPTDAGEDPDGMPSTLIAIDPAAPAETAAWLVPRLPRVHLVQAISGVGVALRPAGGDPVTPCRPPGCVLTRIDAASGGALVELVASGSGRVLESLELRDLVPGEDRLVVALGDADGDPAPRLLELPVRPLPRNGRSTTTTIVHAAALLGPVDVSTLSVTQTYALLAGAVAPGEVVESVDTDSEHVGIAFGPVGGPVLGVASTTRGPSSSIVILTSLGAGLDRAEAIQIFPADGFAVQVGALEAR